MATPLSTPSGDPSELTPKSCPIDTRVAEVSLLGVPEPRAPCRARASFSPWIRHVLVIYVDSVIDVQSISVAPMMAKVDQFWPAVGQSDRRIWRHSPIISSKLCFLESVSICLAAPVRRQMMLRQRFPVTRVYVDV